jgi:hypothetical protein
MIPWLKVNVGQRLGIFQLDRLPMVGIVMPLFNLISVMGDMV